MQYEKRQKRAREIEAAAYRILDEKGFSGLSMQELARASKASNETLYRWYGDKTGLFEALIRGNSAMIQTALASDADTPLQHLSVIGPVLLSTLLGSRAIALNRAAAADSTGTLGRALAREGRDTIAPRIVSLMTDAVAAGQMSGAPREIAETWFSLLIGDLQVRRVTGALAEPRPDYVNSRADTALVRLQRLFPPA